MGTMRMLTVFLVGLALSAGPALAARQVAASSPTAADSVPPWSETARLVGSNADTGDLFGASLAASLDTVVVGAPGTDGEMGSAYLFERNWWLTADHWGQVIELGASDPWTGERFGESVAIDGDTVVVGAPLDGGGVGAAYVFSRNRGAVPNAWGQVTKLVAGGVAGGHSFGLSVAISGDLIVVGEPGHNMAYLYERNQDGEDAWGELARLAAGDGAAGDRFGSAVALSGDTVVVGAPHHATARGAAYVYARNQGGPDNWEQAAKLSAADGAAQDCFGAAIALQGDTAVIGAMRDDSLAGAAYVFARNQEGADQWGQVKKLRAADAVAGGWFGASVAIDDDVVAVGALEEGSGRQTRVYLFARNAGGGDAWGQLAQVSPGGGWPGDLFGSGVAVDGGRVAVGAPYAVQASISAGVGYIFERQGGGWQPQPRLVATAGTSFDEFGWSVAVDSDTAVVGAWSYNAGEVRSGAAYIFYRNQGGTDRWDQVLRLVPGDAASADDFGHAVAIDDDTIVVGARKHDAGGADAGAAYVFYRNQGGADEWGQVRKLLAPSPAAGDRFGHAVALSGDRILVGAPNDENTSCPAGSVDCGIVHVFERNAGGADRWSWVNALLPYDGLSTTAQFGTSVDLAGDTAVVGAPGDDRVVADAGAAWVFERNQGGAEQWWDVAELTAGGLAAGDSLGISVSISGDTAVVGAHKTNGIAADTGAVYVFRRNYDEKDTWGQWAKLVAGDGAASDRLGLTVAIDNDLVVTGAIGVDGGGGDEAGAVYLFARNRGGADAWGQVDRLTATNPAPGQWFGRSLALGGGTILAGAPYEAGAAGTKVGAAYLFRVGPFATYVPLVVRP